MHQVSYKYEPIVRFQLNITQYHLFLREYPAYEIGVIPYKSVKYSCHICSMCF